MVFSLRMVGTTLSRPSPRWRLSAEARDTGGMSEGYLEILREMYGQESLSAGLALAHPEVELHQAREIPDTDDYVGRDDVLRGSLRWIEEWDDFRFHPGEMIDVGARVLLRVRVTGRAKASGIEFDQTAFHLWTFRDGLPWRLDVYMGEREAREAAGLSE